MAVITGLVIGAASAAYSISSNLSAASEAADAQRQAENSAEKSMKKAEQAQSQNFMGALQIPTEAYDKALREGTAQQMQAVQALQEGDSRSLAGGLGKVSAVSLEQQNTAREAQAADLFALNKAQAIEQGDTADKMATMYEEQAAGAQASAAASEKAKVNAITGAAQGVAGVIGQIDNMQPLYGKGAEGRISSRIATKMGAGDAAKTQQYAQALYGKYNEAQLRAFEQSGTYPLPTDLLGIQPVTNVNPFATTANAAAVTTPAQTFSTPATFAPIQTPVIPTTL